MANNPKRPRTDETEAADDDNASQPETPRPPFGDTNLMTLLSMTEQLKKAATPTLKADMHLFAAPVGLSPLIDITWQTETSKETRGFRFLVADSGDVIQKLALAVVAAHQIQKPLSLHPASRLLFVVPDPYKEDMLAALTAIIPETSGIRFTWVSHFNTEFSVDTQKALVEAIVKDIHTQEDKFKLSNDPV